MIFVPKRIHTLFRAGFFFIPPCTTKRGIELVFVQGLFQAIGFHDIRMFFAAMRKRAYALVNAILIDIHQQIRAPNFWCVDPEKRSFP